MKEYTQNDIMWTAQCLWDLKWRGLFQYISSEPKTGKDESGVKFNMRNVYWSTNMRKEL